VYFYKSPYGGRVYFDDLGPPWPKHPCTDHVRTDSHPSGELKKFVAKKETGWRPFFCTGVHSHQKEYGVIVLTSQNEHGETKLYANYDHKLVDHRSPFFIRKHITNQHCYEISTLNSQDKFPCEIRFSAFVSIVQLISFEKGSDKLKKLKKRKPTKPEGVEQSKLVSDIASISLTGSRRSEKKYPWHIFLSDDFSKVLEFIFNLYKSEWIGGQLYHILADCVSVLGETRLIDAFNIIDPEQTLNVKRPTLSSMRMLLRNLVSNGGELKDGQENLIFVLKLIIQFDEELSARKTERLVAHTVINFESRET
jgi:hypothetical protein